jgi:hypothetical protein
MSEVFFFSGTYTDPDGTEWVNTELAGLLHTNPRYRRGSTAKWSELPYLRVIVSEKTQGTPVPDKVRCKRVRGYFGRKIFVHHKQDVLAQPKADLARRAFDADRQQATTGKHKGKWFLSPKLVAESLGIDTTYVSTLRKKGILWMPEPGGKRRKPTTRLFRIGCGRAVDFWLEDEVDEFARCRGHNARGVTRVARLTGNGKRGFTVRRHLARS